MIATTDHAKRDLMLNALRLPTLRQLATSRGEQSDHEGGPAIRTLSVLAEHERADREQRRRARNRAAAKRCPGKTLASFDFSAIPALFLRRRSPPLLQGMPGSTRDQAASPLARPVWARATWPQPSAGN